MIDSSEISVVIQGPIYGNKHDTEENKFTKICCARVRELLPSAEIIISTWENSDVEELEFDQLLLNKDPGGILMRLHGVERMNNTNRMILSTYNGVKVATRKYTIKLRSDMYLENLNFLEKFMEYPITEEKSLVKERIISLSSNCPYRGEKLLFGISDWFEFGYTEDVLRLWDVPLQETSDLIYQDDIADFKDNLVAETYIWVNFVKRERKYLIKLNPYSSIIPYSKESFNLYEESLANYCVLYDGQQLGLNSLKLKNKNYVRRDFAKASCYMHFEWEKMYKKYCNPQKRISLALKDRIDIALYIIVFRLLNKYASGLYKKLRGIYNRNEK